jgi:two-component system phosphate regulon response regulator PhoB
MTPTILVVEDEPAILELLNVNLADAGYAVRSAPDAESAQAQLKQALPDLLLLDWMLPGQSGLALAKELRADARTKELPIIMVTARTDEADKVAGLEAWVDDYVTKPFSPRELLARVRALLRRARPADATEKKAHLRAGDLEIDRHRFEVTMKGKLVELTRKEFELLAALVGTPGRVFGREELLDLVWGHDGFVEPRTVDVHVARLRGKFTTASLPAPGIETVRGVGYRFRDERRS